MYINGKQTPWLSITFGTLFIVLARSLLMQQGLNRGAIVKKNEKTYIINDMNNVCAQQ
jgi:hypothetical protein